MLLTCPSPTAPMKRPTTISDNRRMIKILLAIKLLTNIIILCVHACVCMCACACVCVIICDQICENMHSSHTQIINFEDT